MLDTGATAWLLAAAALVLMMTVPGLAMFYSGQVRAKSALSVVMQCISVTALVSALWMLIGYTLAFDDSQAGIIGGLGSVIFEGLHREPLHGSIPESLFAIFQMAVAVFAAALIIGAYAERIKFSAMLIFSGAWIILVYAPLTHWIMDEEGWLRSLGVMDHAGGLTVHVSAGVAALVIAAMIGPRKEILPPHNPGLSAAGAGLIWVGWLAYSGGMHLTADSRTAMTILVTHIAASSGAVMWSFLEWRKTRKFSLEGTATGAIVGLVTVTSSAGFIGPVSGLGVGILGAMLSFYMVGVVRDKWNIDDPMKIFSVHGIGAVFGVLMLPLALVAHTVVLGPLPGLLNYEASAAGTASIAADNYALQYVWQVLGILVAAVWSAVLTYLIVKAAGRLTHGIRVADEDEIVGLDLAAHGEQAYDYM